MQLGCPIALALGARLFFGEAALAHLPQFANQTAPADSANGVFPKKSSLQIDHLQTARQG
jgi:hypothetical protein